MAKQFIVVLPHLETRVSLQLLHHLNDAVFPCFLQKQVNMVWSAFDGAHMKMKLFCCLHQVGDGQLPGELIFKDWPPVAWRELQVPVRFSPAVRTISIY